jgi:hypothetical protein
MHSTKTDFHYQLLSSNARDKGRLKDDLEIATGLHIVLGGNKE